MRKLKRPQPSMIVALCALTLALTGSAWAGAQLAKNSVGSRQLKAKAVTTGKIANNAVNGAKVANQSLSGEDINLAALGTVPAATQAAQAGDAATLAGHAAACPAATTLIRGRCFDSSPNAVIATLAEAADACAAKGGYLPSPMELYSVRGVINLGTGIGTDHSYTDEIYANTAGTNYSTVVVDGTGAFTEQSTETPARYICTYQLLR
jgi:hypothetical protein